MDDAIHLFRQAKQGDALARTAAFCVLEGVAALRWSLGEFPLLSDAYQRSLAEAFAAVRDETDRASHA